MIGVARRFSAGSSVFSGLLCVVLPGLFHRQGKGLFRAEVEWGCVAMNVAVAKKTLRRFLRTRRASVCEEYRKWAALRIAEAGAALFSPGSRSSVLSSLADPPSVSAFLSHAGELDTGPLMNALHDCAVRLCLPVVERRDAPLLFRCWRPGMNLVPGAFHIDVPPGDAESICPDLLFTPLLGFDSSGRRLGYGGGFYDRTIADLRGRKMVLVVGLAFAVQEIARVPCDCHDESLDAVLTEDGYRSFVTEPSL